jgi:hypothetical protein
MLRVNHFAVENVETEVAAGSDALVKGWDKCTILVDDM